MSSKLAILQTSALPENVKGNTITQECIRWMSNTCAGETQVSRNKILEEYFSQLRMSGYSMEEIEKYATPGLVGYVRRVKRESEVNVCVRDKCQVCTFPESKGKCRESHIWKHIMLKQTNIGMSTD